MKKTKSTILLLFTCVSIYSQLQWKTMEINNIVSFIQSKDEKKLMREMYLDNKELYWQSLIHNSIPLYDSLQNKMLEYEIEFETIKICIPLLIEISKEHRELTQVRNLTYEEGVKCLTRLLENDIKHFDDQMKNISKEMKSIISLNTIEELKIFHAKQMKFINSKQIEFKENEILYYGEMAQNIIEFNHLSFEIIKIVYCTEYDIYRRDQLYELSLDIYEEHSNLYKLLEKYISLETAIVDKLNLEECKKRIGILRHYDGLDEHEILITQKANMLMNFISRINTETNTR